MELYNEETMTKAIRFPVELIEKIETLAKENQRDFSKYDIQTTLLYPTAADPATYTENP